MWQSKCFCSGSRLRRGWFHRKRSLWRRNGCRRRRCFLSLWVALKTGTWKKYTKTEGSWQCFVRAGSDKQEKKKASKPGGSGGNAKKKKKKNLRIIRKEIYCTYSKAVTPCLLQGSNAVLIKEVNHFPELWHAVWLPSPKCQSRWQLRTLYVKTVWEIRKRFRKGGKTSAPVPAGDVVSRQFSPTEVLQNSYCNIWFNTWKRVTAPFPRDKIPPPTPPVQAGFRRHTRPGTVRADLNLFVLLRQRQWGKKKKKRCRQESC